MSSNRTPRLPDPGSRSGAVFYAVVSGLIVSAVLTVIHHVHVVWMP